MAFDLRRVFRSKTSGEFFLLGQEGILVCPYTFDQTVDSDEWVIVHNNNTTNIIAQVYINDELVKPDEIVIASPNAIIIRFSTPVSGYVNLIAYRVGASECGIIGNVTPTPTVSITPSNTPVASVTPTNSVTPTPTPTFVPSPTASPTATPSLTVTPTLTPTQGATVTPAVTPTLSGTPVVTPTNTVTPTVTPTVTTTTTPQVTPPASITPTPPITLTPTPTVSGTPAVTITPTASITPTSTPAVTPTPTVTPSSVVASEAFTSGGDSSTPLDPSTGRQIDRFPFAAPFGTATNVGVLSPSPSDIVFEHAGQSALGPGVGYISGGRAPSILAVIESFPFSAPFSSVNNIGFLSQARDRLTGHSSSTDGYSSGGALPSSPFRTDRIDRFPFSASPTTATDIGNLTDTIINLSGHQSNSDGYTSGGQSPTGPTGINVINTFPFSNPFTTATDAGDLSRIIYDSTGHSSPTDGFTAGGTAITDVTDRFPFSTPFTTATNIGTLSRQVRQAAGQSSTSNGYVSGGLDNLGPGQTNRVDSFPFSAPFASSTDVGNLFVARFHSAGHQG